MARLVLSAAAVVDLQRLTDFLLEHEPAHAFATTAVLLDGLQILARHPLVGRIRGEPYRELIISRGRTGYVALYEYDTSADLVIVHSIRHQRESGFAD